MSFVPGHSNDGLLPMIEMRVIPKRRRKVRGGSQKFRVFSVCDLARRHLKSINPNTMHRALVVLPVFGPHGEPTLRNGNQDWFENRGYRGGDHCIKPSTEMASGCARAPAVMSKLVGHRARRQRWARSSSKSNSTVRSRGNEPPSALPLTWKKHLAREHACLREEPLTDSHSDRR